MFPWGQSLRPRGLYCPRRPARAGVSNPPNPKARSAGPGSKIRTEPLINYACHVRLDPTRSNLPLTRPAMHPRFDFGEWGQPEQEHTTQITRRMAVLFTTNLKKSNEIY